MAMHKVKIRHSPTRTRAECSGCGWKSPWITATVQPDDDGVPPRQNLERKAVKVAQWHLWSATRPAVTG